jgi:hypothetical protein
MVAELSTIAVCAIFALKQIAHTPPFFNLHKEIPCP